MPRPKAHRTAIAPADDRSKGELPPVRPPKASRSSIDGPLSGTAALSRTASTAGPTPASPPNTAVTAKQQQTQRSPEHTADRSDSTKQHAEEHPSASPVGCCELPHPMHYAGRMYLSPKNKKQLWLNFGWNAENAQLFPPYQELLAPAVTREQYEALLVAVEHQIDTFGPPCYSGSCLTLSLGLVGMLTCGVSCLLASNAVDAYDDQIENGLKIAARASRCTFGVSLERIANTNQRDGKLWLDAEGRTLERAGGPPRGYNIVLLLPQELQGWPSVALPRTASAVGGEHNTEGAAIDVTRSNAQDDADIRSLPGQVTEGAPSAQDGEDPKAQSPGDGVLSHRTHEMFLLEAPPPRRRSLTPTDTCNVEPQLTYTCNVLPPEEVNP